MPLPHSTSQPDPNLWPAWWDQLEQWRERSGIKEKQEWAAALGFDPRVVRRWKSDPRSVQNDTMQRLVTSLFKLRRQLGPTPEQPLPAADMLDWLALINWHWPRLAALLTDPHMLELERPLARQTFDWLQPATRNNVVWPALNLPRIYQTRPLEADLAHALTDRRGYQQPRYRALLLGGPAASGKSTLAAALLRLPAVRTHFRSGALWLTEDRLQRADRLWGLGWRRWLTHPHTVGLVIFDDITQPELLLQLLAQAGPQVQWLLTSLHEPVIAAPLDSWLGPDNWQRRFMPPWSQAEGRRLVIEFHTAASRPEAAAALNWVVDTVAYPGPLALLAGQAQMHGWPAVQHWLQQQLPQETPLAKLWPQLLSRSWTQLPPEQQLWLTAIAQALPGAHSFGPAFAGGVWGIPANRRCSVRSCPSWYLP